MALSGILWQLSQLLLMGCNGPHLHFSKQQRVHLWKEPWSKLGRSQSVVSASCTQVSGRAQQTAEITTPQQQESAASLFANKKRIRAAVSPPSSMDSFGAPPNDALPPSDIRALVASAARGFLTNSRRGHRIFWKVAGTLCQRAREKLGAAGLLWSKAAWDGSLHAAMAGLKELAGTADAGLQQGFEAVLTSIKQAHLEGLRQPACAFRGARKTAASPAHASPAATSQARPPAGGASRKARRAREELASYFFGDKVPHSFLCGECSNPATFAVRGSKGGSDLKYSCGVHREVTGCFRIEKTRTEWARDCEVHKLKAELARALDEESRLRGNRGEGLFGAEERALDS
ncbi:hypothetical protein KFL_012870020 [Klebsormidium nitens]|uniref:Uncharacterized protein n=1 Tax=Klebsormidium nitens TaxID=105231 RepID=A0A1Y1IQE3_KLENI|nr:hypothetical protein KFL_012870020 [Klebsormidium nitens]|eukprot:GAQ93080.1 hypothetical protein KFL_012870020 [Klebsormidium nitens]